MDNKLNKTPEQIEKIEEEVINLVESNQVPNCVAEYIGLLQDSINNYQGELYSKNSRITELEYDNAELNRALQKDALNSKSNPS